jgi:hypothetical protein
VRCDRAAPLFNHQLSVCLAFILHMICSLFEPSVDFEALERTLASGHRTRSRERIAKEIEFDENVRSIYDEYM